MSVLETYMKRSKVPKVITGTLYEKLLELGYKEGTLSYPTIYEALSFLEQECSIYVGNYPILNDNDPRWKFTVYQLHDDIVYELGEYDLWKDREVGLYYVLEELLTKIL